MRILLCLCVALGFACGQATPPPNIVLVLADDLGYGDVGCFNAESKIPTPNIDRLASQGMRLTDAHSPSSVCTPTRYGIMTGRYAWRTRLKRSVLWAWDPPLLEDERTTLPEMLREGGYDTACIGKWHLGWDWPLGDSERVTSVFNGFTIPPKRRKEFAKRVNWSRAIKGGPLSHGFDHYFGDDVPNFPPYVFIENEHVTAVPSVQKPKSMFGHAGPAAPGWDLSTIMPMITQRSASWIDQRKSTESKANPFFLYVPLTAPHTPIAPSPHFRGKSGAGTYGDFVVEVDWTMGQIMEALDRNGLSENTLVIFTSDNGSPQRNGNGMTGPVGSVKKEFGHDSSRPWRGLKSDAWEGGHRVPFIARWPSRIAEGTSSDQPWIHTDFYRSLCALTQSELHPKNAEDSFDLSALFSKDLPTQAIRGHLVHHSGQGMFAIRSGRWKLILGRKSGGFSRYSPPKEAPKGQLYDLEADPSEKNNLYSIHPEIVQRLTTLLSGIKSSGRSHP